MPVYPASLADAAPELLATLLEVSPSGVVIFRPLYAADDPAAIVDLAYVHLNPAARQQLRLAECPTQSFRTRYAQAPVTFEFYRDTFVAGEARHCDVRYQYDGLDKPFHLVAQRSGELLVVTLVPQAADAQPDTAQVLRASYTREQAAHLEAEARRQRLYGLLMQLPGSIATYRGPEHVYEFVNAAYQRLFPQRTLQGLPLRQALPELEGQHYFEVFDQVYQTAEPHYSHEQETWVDFDHTGKLEQRYFNTSVQPIYNAQGQLDGLLNFAYDVTEQVRARQQVQRLNEELASVNAELQASNGEFLLANTELAQSSHALRQLTQELETRVQERTQEAQDARAEAETQRTELQRIFEEAPVAICIFRGPGFVVELANAALGAAWGFAPAEVIGHGYAEKLPPAVAQRLEPVLAQVLATGEPALLHEVPLTLTRPHPLAQGYFSFVFQPLAATSGQAAGIIAVGTEVTEQVQARQQVQTLNEELAVINEELQAANEELGTTNQQLTRTNIDLDTFIYTASHDLKAPITNIEGLLIALQTELPPAGRVGEVNYILQLIQESVDRFKRTIALLTDVSSLQKEHAQAASEVRLATIIEYVRLDLAPLIQSLNAEVEVVVPASAVLTFSEKNLRSVVYNLLSNALKYHHPKRLPRVRLSYRTQDSYQVLEVQDNGLGLDLAHGEQKIFGMFQRLHTHVEGSGIGLYMVKKMVENAGGRIAVQSQLGLGSSFFVYFLR